MGRLMLACLFCVVAPAAAPGGPALERFEFTRVEMAVPIKLVLYAKDRGTASRGADAALDRIHALDAVMSDYKEESELNRLCRTAGEGKPVRASADLWNVLDAAQRLAAASDGAFDVTVGPVVRLWRRARRRKELPDAGQLAAARMLVGFRLLRLDARQHTAELLKAGMQLDLGGIAKGYATDQALATLRKAGITRALVDAGGDLGLGDPPPGQPGWRIGLTTLDGTTPVQYLLLSRTAVSTSGDNVQFVEIGGRRWSHVVDPRTGMALTDHARVTVVAPNGMIADGLTKVVAVLGPEKGFKLIEETAGAAALLLRAPEGKPQRHQSARWKDLPVEPAAAP
jgi:thiamine biosynthesis lipoprotein